MSSSDDHVLGPREVDNAAGCAYLLDNSTALATLGSVCGAPRQRGSPYCERHHAVCHVSAGSRAERQRLRELDALASAVGGRRARPADHPSDSFLRRLERALRHFCD